MRKIVFFVFLILVSPPSWAGEIPTVQKKSTVGVGDFSGYREIAEEVEAAIAASLEKRNFRVVADGRLREEIKKEIDWQDANREYFRKTEEKGRWIRPELLILRGYISFEDTKKYSGTSWRGSASMVEWRITVSFDLVKVGTLRREKISVSKKFTEVQGRVYLPGMGSFDNGRMSELDIFRKVSRAIGDEVADRVENFVSK